MSYWKNFFEKVYVINLDSRPDRWKQFQVNIKRIAWPFKKPIRIGAVNALIAIHLIGGNKEMELGGVTVHT